MLCIRLLNRLSESVLRQTTSRCNSFNHQHLRCCASKSLAKESNEIKLKELKENWEPIYRYPNIKTISTVAKLKNYQLVGSVVGLPIVLSLDFFDPFVYCYSAVVALVTLSIASYAVRNTIGFIYVNKTNKDLIRFAFINFYGNRDDLEVKIEDITPFSELPKRPTDKLYTKLTLANQQHALKLISREVEVMNSIEFMRVFGEDF
jgi:hypothetical protein